MEQDCWILLQSRRIMLTGKGASFLVAQDFCLKLRKLGMNASAESDNPIQLAELAHFGSKDVLFMLIESGETPEIVAIALTTGGLSCLAALCQMQYPSKLLNH